MSTSILPPKSSIIKPPPKRKRTRAKRACFHCKKAKTSCSNERPCKRCVRLGHAETCIDTPRSDINEDEKKLWEQTLHYLTTKKQSPDDEEELQFRNIISQFAKRASGSSGSSIESLHIPQQKTLSNTPYNQDNALNYNDISNINYLTKQNEELTVKVQSLLNQLEHKRELDRSFFNFSVLSTYGDLSYSLWTYPDNLLIDYNHGFLQLCQRNPSELPIRKFCVKQLHHEKHVFSCKAILFLIYNGLVDYIEMNQEWCTPSGIIPVKTFLNITSWKHEEPTEFVLYSKKSNFPFPVDSLFKPLDIGLSNKAKRQKFDIAKYFANHNYLPDFIKNKHPSSSLLSLDNKNCIHAYSNNDNNGTTNNNSNNNNVINLSQSSPNTDECSSKSPPQFTNHSPSLDSIAHLSQSSFDFESFSTDVSSSTSVTQQNNSSPTIPPSSSSPSVYLYENNDQFSFLNELNENDIDLDLDLSTTIEQIDASSDFFSKLLS